MLLRADHKSAGGKWGVPAGKVDPGEMPLLTAQRETLEETGIDIPMNRIIFFDTVYVRYPDYDFIYHIFHADIESEKDVTIRREEHQDFRWVTPGEALAFGDRLVPDEDDCIRLVYDLRA